MKRNNKKGPPEESLSIPSVKIPPQISCPVRGAVSFVNKVQTILRKLYFLKAFAAMSRVFLYSSIAACRKVRVLPPATVLPLSR